MAKSPFAPHNLRAQRTELYKQSPALAMADMIMGERSRIEQQRAKRMPTYAPGEEPTLADKFIAATYTLGPSATAGWARKRIDETMLQQRIVMRKAHRFVLSNEFVRYATEASTVDSKKLLARVQFATLPYDVTWIEFDLHTKVRTLRALHAAPPANLGEISPRLGVLLQRIDDTTGVATLVSEAGDSADMHLLSHYFSIVERRNWPAFNGIVPLTIGANSVRDEEIVNHADGGMWGYTMTTGGGMISALPGSGFKDLHTPIFLKLHGHTGTNPLFSMYRAMWGTDAANNQRMADLCKLEITEFAGHMRWLVTVLAMLNEVPIHSDYVMPSHQQRVGRTQKVKFVDYHRVTLRLPKLRPLPFIERHISGDVERRHRAHEVRAHWRTYLHEQHCAREEHAWEYDHENGYRLCGKCMAYSRLIHEHVRGDASLGWIRKDYVIKKDAHA